MENFKHPSYYPASEEPNITILKINPNYKIYIGDYINHNNINLKFRVIIPIEIDPQIEIPKYLGTTQYKIDNYFTNHNGDIHWDPYLD